MVIEEKGGRWRICEKRRRSSADLRVEEARSWGFWFLNTSRLRGRVAAGDNWVNHFLTTAEAEAEAESFLSPLFALLLLFLDWILLP